MSAEAYGNLQIPEDIHAAIVFTIEDKGQKQGLSDKKIDNKLVHKNLVENVFITDPIILDKEKHIYRTKIIPELNHSFFFDHSLEHLPGMLILEAARQFGTAISHVFFDTPFDSQFILHELTSQFVAGAMANRDVFIDVMITNIKMKKGELRRMTGVGYVHQDNQIIGKITSSWSIIPRNIITHLTKFH